jgi:FtsP/CotA-like multicopper oxidase with cupredoxin domain
MKKRKIIARTVILIAVLIFMTAGFCGAMLPTVTGPTFNLTAKDGTITTPDSGSYYMFGYADNNGLMQYPGPTLDVNEGDTVTVNLTNNLTIATSIVFPGQLNVTATGDSNGLLTKEADANGGHAQYSFVATNPGTYTYYSGTNPDLQIEMGMVGALIVRPASQPPGEMWAYNDPNSRYDVENLFLLSELDPIVHELMLEGRSAEIDMGNYKAVQWFINGRAAPDTMLDAFDATLPTQPYNCMPMMNPGQKMLLRFIGGGRDSHPFHTHGNNFWQIARDGRELSSNGNGADLAISDYTLTVAAGETGDAIFTWTGEKLGWDIYGHDANAALESNEYAPDHGKPFPVILPDNKDLTIGTMWSGSPFLGSMGSLPPGLGGFNPDAGYTFMWHSHNEREMTNNNIFPGGMMTMLMIVPPGVPVQ